MKKRGLGRNLDVLLSRPTQSLTVVKEKENPVDKNAQLLTHLPVELLQRGHYQPRKEMAPENLQELANSIKMQGVLQPILVRSVANDRYEIIAGERRWRAAQLAGLTTVPVMIREITGEDALAIALIENIQREDLNPIEEAIALQRLLDEFGMTHQEVAHAVGKSRTTVTNLLRLLSLQPEVKDFLEQGKLEMGHARAILSLSNVEQTQIAHQIIEAGLSVRATELLVKQWQSDKVSSPVTEISKDVDPYVENLQQQFSDRFGSFVVLQHKTNGKGKMIVHYKTLKELENILNKIQ